MHLNNIEQKTGSNGMGNIKNYIQAYTTKKDQKYKQQPQYQKRLYIIKKENKQPWNKAATSVKAKTSPIESKTAPPQIELKHETSSIAVKVLISTK